jgi:hypothetical protein
MTPYSPLRVRRFGTITYGIASAILWLSPSLLAADAAVRPPIDIAHIADAMDLLGNRAGDVRIRWQEAIEYGAGGIFTPAQAKEMELAGELSVTGIPSHPLKFDCPGELLLKSDWMRLTTKACENINGVTRPMGFVSSNDGAESRFLETSDDGRKNGDILKVNHNHQFRSVRLFPLLLYLRPFSAPFNVLLRDHLVIKDQHALLNGHACVVVQDGQRRAWIDPSRACIALAIEEYLPDGRITFRADIDYLSHPTLFWFPASYMIRVFDVATRSIIAVSYQVTHITIEPHLSLHQRDFALTFEPGTTVYDERKHAQYVVASDGSNQPLHARRQSRKLTVAAHRPSTRLLYLVGANVLCIIAFGTAWFLRRQRRH